MAGFSHLNKLKLSYKLNSMVTVATFQAFSSLLQLVTAVLNITDTDIIHPCRKLLGAELTKYRPGTPGIFILLGYSYWSSPFRMHGGNRDEKWRPHTLNRFPLFQHEHGPSYLQIIQKENQRAEGISLP